MKFLFFIIYLFLFLIVRLVFKLSIKKNYLLYFLLLLIFLFLFLFPSIILNLVGNFSILDSPHVSLPIVYSSKVLLVIDFYTLVTLIFILVGYIIFSLTSKKTELKPHFSMYKYILLFKVFNIISVISTVVLIVLDFNGNIVRLLLTYMSFLIFVLPFLKIMLRSRISKFQTIFMMVNISLFLYLNLYMENGVRTAFITLVGSLIIALLMKNQKTIIFKKKKSQIFLVLLSIVTVHLSVILQYVRWNLHKANDFKSIFNLLFMNNKEAYLVSIYQGDIIYFYRAVVRTFHVIPNYHDFIYGDTYLRLIFFFLPHSLFPNIKPEETQLIMSSILNPQMYIYGQSLPPTLIGDLYINFGYLGPLGGIFIGLTLALLQRILNRDEVGTQPITIAIGSTIFAIILLYFRGTFNAFYYFIFIYISIILFMFLLNIFTKRGVSD